MLALMVADDATGRSHDFTLLERHRWRGRGRARRTVDLIQSGNFPALTSQLLVVLFMFRETIMALLWEEIAKH